MIESLNTDSVQAFREDLAAALRWAARLNYHEAVANHFSVAVNQDGSQFLINPNQRHFALVKASDLLLLDANNDNTLSQPQAPDPTAWGLHGAIHRHCPHARCVLHTHSTFSTVLACLKDPTLPAIDQNTAQFYNRVVYDNAFDGMAFIDEGERYAALLKDPDKNILLMGNHGLVVLGVTVADAFNRLFYFERSAETYIRALQTDMELNVLTDQVAEKTALQWQNYQQSAQAHFAQLRVILDQQDPDYRL
ncbi:MAG: class II aldolase/adducin family protein [Porticoccaceae bacterium]